MKKFYLVLTMLILSFLIVACGQGNDTDNVDNNSDVSTNDAAQNNNTSTANNDDNIADNGMTDNSDQTEEEPAADPDDQIQKMESLEYIDFELAVEYTDEQEYEADLELDNNRVEAKLEDDLNGVEIEGDGAFDEIYPLVEQLTIDQNTSKEDVIQQIIDVFDLPSDYNEFELEITFKDGTKKEYNDRQ